MKKTTFNPGDLVTIGEGGTRVYRVNQRIVGQAGYTGRPMYTLLPLPDHPRGAKRLQDGLRRFAFDELRPYDGECQR